MRERTWAQSPEDMLLAAVGQCLVVGYAGTCAERGVEIRSLQIEVSGRVDFMAAYRLEDGNPGFPSVASWSRSTPMPLVSSSRTYTVGWSPKAAIPNTIASPSRG